MNKSVYLSELRDLLDQYEMEDLEKEDIINDYDEMYEVCLEKGMSDEDTFEKLGAPEEIIESLTEGFELKEKVLAKKERRTYCVKSIYCVIFVFWDWIWIWFVAIFMDGVSDNTSISYHFKY